MSKHLAHTEILIEESAVDTQEDEPAGTVQEAPAPFGELLPDVASGEPRKYYFDGGQVAIATELVYELDADGRQLRVVTLSDYTAEKVRTFCGNLEDLRSRWTDTEKRSEIIHRLAERGIDFESLAAQAGKPDADPFDLLCHLAFNAPVLTRRQRAERFKKERAAFFETYGAEARAILENLLEKYAVDGEWQFTLPDVLKVPPISDYGNVNEIIGKFGGPDELRKAVEQLQTLLYAA
jgi:type I restriction enzyme R subunit